MKHPTICAAFIALSQLAGFPSLLHAQNPVVPTVVPTVVPALPALPATRDTIPASDTLVTNRPVVRECDQAKPAWLFCDDFESDRLSRYFEYKNPDSSFTRADSVGVLGSMGMRVRFRKGQVDAGSLKLAFGKTPSSYIRPVDSTAKDTVYRELYWRVYMRDDSDWTGGGGDKLSRAQVLVSPSWAQAMGAPVWSGAPPPPGADFLVIDPYSGTDATGTLRTTIYNDFPNLRWLGSVRSRTPIFEHAHVGKWYCIEAHVKLNDPDESNGIFELWIDDWLEAQHTGLNWVGNYTTYGLNTVFFENYWNAGSPVTQHRYLDNIVVSTQRIGCGRLSAPDTVPARPDSTATRGLVWPAR